MLRTVAVFALLLGSAARAQDPAATDPDKYRVVFENERVRVLDYRDQPGQRTNRHHHPDSVVIAIGPFHRKLALGDGKTALVDAVAGDAKWVPAQDHVGENVGTTETHVVIVELKDPPAKRPAK